MAGLDLRFDSSDLNPKRNVWKKITPTSIPSIFELANKFNRYSESEMHFSLSLGLSSSRILVGNGIFFYNV